MPKRSFDSGCWKRTVNNVQMFIKKTLWKMPKRSFWEWALKGIDNWWPLSFPEEPRFLHHLIQISLLLPSQTPKKSEKSHWRHILENPYPGIMGWSLWASEFWSWNEAGEKIKPSLFLHLRGHRRDMLVSEKQSRPVKKMQPRKFCFVISQFCIISFARIAFFFFGYFLCFFTISKIESLTQAGFLKCSVVLVATVTNRNKP